MALGQYLGAGSGITKGLFHFEGNSTDSSGNSKNGTDTGMSYGLAYGKIGQGADFDGSTGKVVLSSTMLTNSMSGLTVSMWTKWDNIASTNLCCVASPGLYFAYSIFTANQLGGSIYFSSAYRLKASVAGFSDTTNWNLLTYTWSTAQQNAKFYLNGSLAATSSDTQTSNLDLSQQLTLGTYTGGTTGRYNGKMDEVIFENVAWDAVKIAKYYTFSKGRYAIL